jgi:hypothetical protein
VGHNNSHITELDFSASPYVLYMGLAVGNLTSVTLPVSVSYSPAQLNFAINNLNQTAVDSVLATCDGWANNNGSLEIHGNAIPSAAGLTSKSNLEGRGWTVTVAT